MQTNKTNYKQSKLGLIPEDWEVGKFSDLADKSDRWSITGGPFGSNLKTTDYKSNGVRIIQLQNIGDGFFNDKEKIYTSHEKAKELLACCIYSGEIILSKMGDPVARACILPEKDEFYLMASDGIRLKVDENIFDKYFVFLLLNNIEFRKRAIRVSTGTTRQRIGLGDLKKIPIPLPPLPEQQKIAAILSTWDESLSELDALIAAKNQLKKGLMQQLLTGQKRFPEFVNSQHHRLNRLYEGTDSTNSNSQKSEKSAQSVKSVVKTMNGYKQTKLGLIPEDWKWLKSGNVMKLFGGASFKSSESQEYGIKWLKIANVGINKIKWDVIDYLPKSLIRDFESYLLVKGDIVMALTRPILNGKLKIAIIKENDSAFLNQRVAKLEAMNNNNTLFLYYLIQTKYFIHSMSSAMAGTDPPNLGNKDFYSISIPLPPLPEQQKIAATLSVIDNEIQELENQKTAYQIQKKGLMQVLLTGKVRVKVN